MPRPLAPRSEKQYARVLERAFAPGAAPPAPLLPAVFTWPESQKSLLRAALKRKLGEDASKPYLAQLPVIWAVTKVPTPPSEDEAEAFTRAAATIQKGKRSLVLLPLAVGLRAREVLSLKREDVERAVKTGELKILRKGGKEQFMPAEHVKLLLEEMLTAPAHTRIKLETPGVEYRLKKWRVAGEILSRGSPETQYQLLHRLTRKTGERAGVKKLRPHKLRHVFATRTNEAGAELAYISWLLGHADPKTTMRYVHPRASQAAKFMRPFQG